MKRYDPIPDSNDIGRKKLVLADLRDQAPPSGGGPLIVIEPDECLCGCHERPARGRRFKPGHDTRFRGILQRAHRAGVPVTLVEGGVPRSHSAEGWRRALKARKESKAVRERETRRAKPVLDWLAQHDGKSPGEIMAEMLEADPGLTVHDAEAEVGAMLDEVQQLTTLDQRRFSLH